MQQYADALLHREAGEVSADRGSTAAVLMPHAARVLSPVRGPLTMTLPSGTESLGRLAAAMASGAVLGINRELRAKPAGVRTLGLVSLGAALATISSASVSTPVDAAAVTRVMQGIIAGVGFLGAGVIVHGARKHEVHGLTTAALTWVSACVGIACGLGQWMITVGAVLLSLLLLVSGGPFERALDRRFAQSVDRGSGTPDTGLPPAESPAIHGNASP